MLSFNFSKQIDNFLEPIRSKPRPERNAYPTYEDWAKANQRWFHGVDEILKSAPKILRPIRSNWRFECDTPLLITIDAGKTSPVSSEPLVIDSIQLIDIPSLIVAFEKALEDYRLRQLIRFCRDPYHTPAKYRCFNTTVFTESAFCNRFEPDPCFRAQTKRQINLELIKGGIEPDPGPKQQRTIRAKKTRKKNARVNPPATAGFSLSSHRRIGMPDSFRTPLIYTIPLQQILGGGTTNSLRMTSNAYDVDSALASTAMPFFAELAVIYSRFRTLAIKYEFKVSNSEAFPQGMIYGVMTNSVGATALGQNYGGNPFMHTDILSNVNGSRSSRIYRGRVALVDLFGTRQVYYDDLFVGSTTSSTLGTTSTANCYIGSVSAAIPVAGWFVTGTIELDVVFLRRNALIV